MKMYKDDSSMDESLIGSCTFKLKTLVTKNTDGSYTAPTAALTAGIVGGVLALVAMIWCYCACCRGSQQKVVIVRGGGGEDHQGRKWGWRRNKEDRAVVSAVADA